MGGYFETANFQPFQVQTHAQRNEGAAFGFLSTVQYKASNTVRRSEVFVANIAQAAVGSTNPA